MKTGKSLSDLAKEIERQADSKKDYIANTTLLRVEPSAKGNGEITVELGDKGKFPVSEIAHDQIAGHTGIPRTYYDKMRREVPELLTNNIETWFKKYPTVRMNRTLDNRLRAFLSDRFQPFDNYDFAHAALPILNNRKLNVMSCEITEKRLYIKAVDERLFKDVPVGYKMGDGSHQLFDTCAPAIVLANSEVGYGRLVIESGVYTRACTNMMLFAKGGMKRTHIGARHTLTENMDIDDLDSVLSSAAKRKTMEALWLQARDVINATFDEKVIGRRLEQLAAASKNKLPTKNVEGVMEVVTERFGLNINERGSILQYLIEGGQLNQYGLSNAVTRTAQDSDDYDRATELEYLGGRIIELPRNDWERLTEAA